jgi:serine phosphatase RsbU (regulator of sigma subunit)
MTLRTKLILAFLLLAVLPLVVVTVYSYASSIDALHRTVERESGAVAEQLGQRMELVAEDLDQRVGRLGRLPYRSLMQAGGRESEERAAEFVVGLVEEMGDSAVLVDALEFVPAAPRAMGVAATEPAPAAPEAIPLAAPPAPVAETVVIHLSEMLFAKNKMKELQGTVGELARVVRSENEVMLLPPEIVEGRIEITTDDVLPVELFESLVAIGERAESADFEEMAAQVEERAEAYALRIEAKVKEARGKREEERQERDVERKKKRWSLKRKFDCPVQRDGELVGTVQARVDAQQALLSVLGRVDRAEGEIPFAVDEQGDVYTLEPGHEATLEGLQLAELASGAPHSGNIVGDWVVVTREAPSLGLVFGMARPVGESLAEIRRVTGRNLGYGLAMIGVAMLGIVPLSSRMTRNLSELSAGASRLAGGDLQTRVPVRSRDEIGQLAESFNRMTDDLRRNQEQLVEQERLSKELEMCRQIQDELLPRAGSTFPFAEVNGISIPAREVGGDFFNYFPLPGGDVAIVMGDVSGKGVPAALLMANLQATLKARMPHERDLATLARHLDVEIDSNTPTQSYVTLFVGILDHERLTLSYLNAGHNKQYLIRAGGGLERLEACGRPLGLLPGGDYTARRVDLHTDDFLFLFTDGLVEATGPQGEEFGAQRLEELIIDARTDDPNQLLARVEQASRDHRSGTDAADDATMLALKVVGS